MRTWSGRASSVISALASAIASARSEESHVRVADVGPHADLRLRDANQRANLPWMVHPKLDDRDVRPVAQLQQRQRQADVVVQVPLVPEHAVSRGQELRGDLLGRRLAGAAGDRRDARARPPPDVAGDLLQRTCRVLDLDDERQAGRCRGPPTGPAPSTPAAPCASASDTNAWPSNRSPRIATKKSPAASVRLSIETRPIDASALPRTIRPPVAAAMCEAVSGSGSTRLRHPTAGPAARQRRTGNLDVVERQRSIANDLILLVTLSRDQHEISAPRLAHCPLDCLTAVDNRQKRRAARSGRAAGRRAICGHHDAALDLLDDRQPGSPIAGCRR